MSDVSGQRVANLTKQVLQKMQNNQCFKLFYGTVVTTSKKHPSILEAALTRQKTFLEGLKLEQGPHRIQQHQAIDLMVNAIDNRFNQASFDVYAKMESLLVKCLNCQDYSTELHFLGTDYGEDVDVRTLNVQLEISKVLM